MLRGAIALQSGIWAHASYESNRLHRARAFQTRLEDVIFTDTTLDELSTRGKVTLYELVSSNVLDSMNYLQKLSNDTQKNISALDTIQAQSDNLSTPPVSTSEDQANIDLVKKMILAKIRDKKTP